MSRDIDKKPDLVKGLRHVNILYMFAVTIIANILVGGVIGYFLDKHTFKNRVLFVIFLVLGIASGLYQGIRELLKEVQRIEPLEPEPKEENVRREDKGTP